MGSLEQKLNALGRGKILLWKRFIDDVFIIWIGSPAKLEEYMRSINTIHDTIKFTHEMNNQEITFLDVTLYKGQRFHQTGILDIKTHKKKTNKQLYVHADSYHPPGTKKGIAKGETNRYLRTNSNETNFNTMSQKLKNKLKERGYKEKQIDKQIKSVSYSIRKTALMRKQRQSNKPCVTFVTRYTDMSKPIKDIIVRNNWKLTQEHPTLRNIFPETPIVAFKRNPSLRNKLVRSKLKPKNSDESLQPQTESTYQNDIQTVEQLTTMEKSYPWNLFNHDQKASKWRLRNCKICKKLVTTNFIKSTKNNRRFQIQTINRPITCKGLYTYSNVQNADFNT